MSKCLGLLRLCWLGCAAPVLTAVCERRASAQTPANESAAGQNPAVYTVFRLFETGRDSSVAGCELRNRADLSMAVGIVEFNDDGSFSDSSQLPVILDCITESRRHNGNGVIVLAFAHGWHHNAAWDIEHDSGDLHFKAFRRVMMSLVLREAERNQSARRVIGVYLGWRGKASEGLLSSISDYLTFWSRLNTATRIGNGEAIKNTIRGIVETTKGKLSGEFEAPDSPLIFAGHSMGALLIETAFFSLLRREPSSLLKSRSLSPASCAAVYRGTQAVEFPDLVLLLNAATDSRLARQMRELLDKEQLSRQVQCDPLKYATPVLVSVTSEADGATKTWFPAGKRGRRTEGHDRSLITHSLTRHVGGVQCSPKSDEHIMVSYNQSWHCLRRPVVVGGRLTSMAIDLPQESHPGDYCHVRYRLTPLQHDRVSSFWNFQVPREVMGGHNDVFNTRSNLFVMALAQASGGVLSLANKWPDVFEPEQGSCVLHR
jgi:hypothetical protein